MPDEAYLPVTIYLYNNSCNVVCEVINERKDDNKAFLLELKWSIGATYMSDK